jgi:hypothetical protein
MLRITTTAADGEKGRPTAHCLCKLFKLNNLMWFKDCK